MIFCRLTSQPDWKPDFQDASLIDDGKANFIYEAADRYIGETIQVADDLRKSAHKLLVFLTGAVSAVSGFMLLKCEVGLIGCGVTQPLFDPARVLLLGYFLAALLIVSGCLLPRHFKFRGNEPQYLLRHDVCRDDLRQIKVRMAVGMQKDIAQNRRVNNLMAYSLLISYLMAVIVPVLSLMIAR